VTLKALTRKLGVSRESSQLAACIGTNFNNDAQRSTRRPQRSSWRSDGLHPRPIDQLIIV